MEIYTIKSDELDHRLDCFYYRPEFNKLEKVIKRVSTDQLQNYVRSIAGGATPKKTQRAYYADEKIGVPFLRVQNITEEGLDLEGCMFITRKIHEGMLKRSQVKATNLLTTITGKLAISTVAPEGFEGNINQHSVVIKTDDKKTSEVLAAFLNSNIGQKLASRRSSGGTRPALDYKSLKSIPIVFKPSIVNIMNNAYTKKNEKEIEAKKIFKEIDHYILRELSFDLPEIDVRPYYITKTNTIKNRLDPRFYKKHFIKFEKMLDLRSDLKTIDEISDGVHKGSTPKARGDAYTTKYDGVPFIRIVNIAEDKINLTDVLYIKRKINDGRLKTTRLKPNDLLLSIAGTIGLSVVVPIHIKEANINQALSKINLKNGIDPHYVSAILNSPIGRWQTERISTPSVQTNINLEDVKALMIPIPKDESIQTKIANKVKSNFTLIEKLRNEGFRHGKQSKINRRTNYFKLMLNYKVACNQNSQIRFRCFPSRITYREVTSPLKTGLASYGGITSLER